ncbi:olfactory receptor 14I1-like protein [Willisornis vidua]|uniref:Olfactory receptor 14I1-like protein n=1 Tax=Willisornis vidua TaxID=1566151 RepID=A0ABQ9D9Q0_9PASS|nr:olfactory receptor 14I1-like protein [Willisornis vidua]
MHFFLLNLSLTDMGSICTTVPKAMANYLWDTQTISYARCAAQVFVFILEQNFPSSPSCATTATLPSANPCTTGPSWAAAAWASGFLTALLHTANTFSLPLCQSNALGQFCEIPQILKLSCSHSDLRKIGLLCVSVSLGFGCFIFIVFLYVQIFRALLRIPSEQGWHKAFFICLPHLAMVSLFVSTATFAYLKPPSISSSSLDLALSVLYSVLPPVLKPLIYSLRNNEIVSVDEIAPQVGAQVLSSERCRGRRLEGDASPFSHLPKPSAIPVAAAGMGHVNPVSELGSGQAPP